MAQLAGAVQHLAAPHPAPDRELHGDPQVAARDPHLPEPLPAAALGRRQRGLQHPHLQAGADQARGRGVCLGGFFG